MADVSHTFSPPGIEELNLIIPGYNFESFLAQGGMGAVYLARHKSLDRQVAVKVLPLGGENDEQFRNWFLSEARTMAKLTHPNLVVVYDFGEVDSYLYIVMEYVAGVSLYELEITQGLEIKESIAIIRDVARGLQSAHDEGILHRDVKPANILMTLSRQPKLGDFGLSQEVSYETDEEGTADESKSTFGTPDYLAPEAWGNSNIDGRSDLYSLGVVLYQLLTGKLPRENNFLMPSDCIAVDATLDEIIAKAVHPDREQRYARVGDFAKALDEWLLGNRTRPISPGQKQMVMPVGKSNAPRGAASTVALVHGGVSSQLRAGSALSAATRPVQLPVGLGGVSKFKAGAGMAGRPGGMGSRPGASFRGTPGAGVAAPKLSAGSAPRPVAAAKAAPKAAVAPVTLTRPAVGGAEGGVGHPGLGASLPRSFTPVKVAKKDGVNVKVLLLGILFVVLVAIIVATL